MTRFLSIIILMLTLVACSSTSGDDGAAVVNATTQGHNDAEALVTAAFTTERELHSALLSVKSREWKLRQQGDTIGAAAYMKAFKAYIVENDAELAGKLFR